MIRHRRLYAFYESEVLNAMMMTIVASLFLAGYTEDLSIAAFIGLPAFLLFAGYSMWLWIKKPSSIVINRWLSNINGFYGPLFLVCLAFYNYTREWLIVPVAAIVIILFLALVRPKGETFTI